MDYFTTYFSDIAAGQRPALHSSKNSALSLDKLYGYLRLLSEHDGSATHRGAL
jgi:hypothetical protein